MKKRTEHLSVIVINTPFNFCLTGQFFWDYSRLGRVPISKHSGLLLQ